MTQQSDDDAEFEARRRLLRLLFWLAMAFALVCILGSLAVAVHLGVFGARFRPPLVRQRSRR